MNGAEFEVKQSPGSGLDKFDVAFFTASCDDAETNRRYAEQLKLDYPILSDPDRKAAEAYGVVNQERRVPQRWTFYIGEDGTILYIDKAVKPASHGPDIAERLESLAIRRRR